MAAEDGVWHFGYLPERYMHRVSPTVERALKEMSRSAVNKLEEALLMCGGKRRTLPLLYIGGSLQPKYRSVRPKKISFSII